ncbi:hypothetical protein Hdeb2414_s0007g00256671 [Helianthus debilis subsp. tardiflorus]
MIETIIMVKRSKSIIWSYYVKRNTRSTFKIYRTVLNGKSHAEEMIINIISQDKWSFRPNGSKGVDNTF